ncbi:MAG TPA: c-type cytochrome [Candidatus Acidoferrales bacterium]|nr:c-type cytochrome [Candidatus Acidoferrales bacterium]
MRGFLTGVLLTLLVICLVTFLVAKKGYMDFNADQEPSLVERKMAMEAVDASTDRHAPDLKNPVAANDENLVAGAKLYVNHCAGCHGLPSNPDSQFGRSFYPTVPAFFKDSPDMPDNQNFYIIQHGIRWTGMPGWNKTLNDTQMWQLVTFLGNIEKLPPAAKKELDLTGVSAPAGTTPEKPSAAPMPMNH